MPYISDGLFKASYVVNKNLEPNQEKPDISGIRNIEQSPPRLYQEINRNNIASKKEITPSTSQAETVEFNPLKKCDTYAHHKLALPANILVSDVMNPTACETKWIAYEELKWEHSDARLIALPIDDTDKRNNAFEYWRYINTNSTTAYAIFQETPSHKPRLFVTHLAQHIGIKVNLGNPVYAGMIRLHKSGIYEMDNNSGHYQPPANINLKEIMALIVPKEALNHFEFKTVQDQSPSNRTRLHHISSPEQYSHLVNSLKTIENRGSALINYLKEHNLWESLKEESKHQPWIKDLMNREETQIYPLEKITSINPAFYNTEENVSSTTPKTNNRNLVRRLTLFFQKVFARP